MTGCPPNVPTESTMPIGALLNEAAPASSAAEAEALVRSVYGITGRATPLASERDHNFRIRTDGTESYVLKISHPAEDPGIADFQVEALRHIARSDPGLPVPRVIPTRDGQSMFVLRLADGRSRIVRLMSYLDGTMLGDAARTARQDRNLGIFLGRLGLALRDFHHASNGDDDLLWDLREFPRTLPFVALIENADRRALVLAVHEAFEERIAPLLPALRAQVVHNDMNPDNVVVSGADTDMVTGIIDFGDMVHGPLICDVAIGAAYRWSPGEPALAGAGRFLAGYASVCPLLDGEVDLLPDLIAARLATAVTMANWQAERFPENRDYVMRFNAEFWASLQGIAALSREERSGILRQHLRKA